MSEEISEETKIVRNTLMWIWNVSWVEFAKKVFDVDWENAPKHKRDYLQKFKVWQISDPAELFAQLDYGKMNRVTAAAKEKYGKVAQ